MLYTANGSAIEVWHLQCLRSTRQGLVEFDVFVEARDEKSARRACSKLAGKRRLAGVLDVHRCHAVELMLAGWSAALVNEAKGKTT